MRNMFGRPILSAIAAAVSLLALQAQAQSVSQSAAEGGRYWFVELAGSPVADGAALGSVLAEKLAFRREAAAAGVRFSERRAFHTLFNGFSIEADAENRLKLLRLKGVKAVYPVETITRPAVETGGTAPTSRPRWRLTGADIAQNQFGLSGAGVTVGIIDTGIDIDHPAFGGSGTPGTTPFPNARVVAGYDFVGDAYNSTRRRRCARSAPGRQSRTTAPATAPTCRASSAPTAAASRASRPGVSFGAYRVFGCAGIDRRPTSSSRRWSARCRRRAGDQHEHRLGAQWPQYPTAQASSRLVNKGVVMVASIGNNGPGGSPRTACGPRARPASGQGHRRRIVRQRPALLHRSTARPTATCRPPARRPRRPPAACRWRARARRRPPTTPASRCRRAACRQGRADPPRHLRLLREGHQRPERRRRRRRALQQRRRRHHADGRGHAADHDPGGGDHAAQGATLDGRLAAGPTTLTWSTDYVSSRTAPAG